MGQERIGSILLRCGRPLSDPEQLLRAVAQVTAVVLLRQQAAEASTESQPREELLAALLNDPQQHERVYAQLRRLNIDLSRPHVVLLVRPAREHDGKVAIWAAAHVRRVNGLADTSRGHLALLIPGDDPETAAGEVYDELTGVLGHPVTVTGAGPVVRADDVARCYLEARRYLDAGVALGITGRPVSAQQLGFPGLLLAEKHNVVEFIDSVIGPVIEYDRQRFTELTHTLEAYFGANQSITKAAQPLHVHPNTVARRLERVTELLTSEWQQPERLLEIQLALRLHRIRCGALVTDD
jgi:sugar diacid utilization regulator